MISAIIITKNEEKLIETCLKSLKWADEIIVADSGSIDKTLDIAKKYATMTFVCKGDNFSKWRTEAMEKATGDWVLYVDSDERVLESLQKEIIELISKNEYSAYAVSRKNIIFGKEEKYGPFWPDWVVRLIKKSSFKRWIGEVHEYPEYEGKLGYTKNSLLHLTHRNLDQVVLKSLDWSKIDAKLRFDANHPKMSTWRFLRILFSELFNQGILRKGFFAGEIGTIDSLLQTFSLVMTYIRLWELQQNKPLEEKYKEIDEDLLKNNFNL